MILGLTKNISVYLRYKRYFKSEHEYFFDHKRWWWGLDKNTCLCRVVTKQMFLFVKWCFILVFVIGAKRLRLLHTSLTGEDSKVFVKKTALEAHARSCHLLAYFCHCSLHKTNLVAPLMEFSSGRPAGPSGGWGCLRTALYLRVVLAGLCCRSLFCHVYSLQGVKMKWNNGIVICRFNLHLLWHPGGWVVSLITQKVCGRATGRAELNHSSSSSAALSHSLNVCNHLRKVTHKVIVRFHGCSHTLKGWSQFFKRLPLLCLGAWWLLCTTVDQ